MLALLTEPMILQRHSLTSYICSRKSMSMLLCSGIFICQVFSFLMDGLTNATNTEMSWLQSFTIRKITMHKRCGHALCSWFRRTYRLIKLRITNFCCSKPLPQGISVTYSQSASCCGWRDRWGIGEYSRAKWNEKKVAKTTSLAFRHGTLHTGWS